MLEWDISSTALGSVGTSAMFPVRMTGQVPTPPIGQDLCATGFCDGGQFYYCKGDDGHRLVRATERLFTTLADHVNIPVAPSQSVEVEGELLFGSRKHPSTEEAEAVKAFCSQASRSEFGSPSRWKASYFSSLFVFDIFIGNGDRSINNLVAYRDFSLFRILAIDFAASTLLMNPGVDIVGDRTQTRAFSSMMRLIHGFDEDAASEMISSLENVPYSFIETVLDRMPTGWLDAEVGRRFLEFWGGGSRIERLARLRAGLKDGSLC